MSVKRDYYEILGLTKGAGKEEIEKAARRLATRYHPDRNAGDEDAAAKFREVTTAAEVLLDPQKREAYDRYGHAGLEGMGGGAEGFGFNPGSPIHDLFSDLLGSFFGGGSGRGGRGGRTLQMILDVTLQEAYTGTKKTINLRREEICNECNGSGARRGTRPTNCRTCGGQGVVIRRQGFFQVQQTCRACEGRGYIIPDPCPNCSGRGRVQLPISLDVDVPPGVDNNIRLQVRGQGEVGPDGGQRGDLELIIRIQDHPHFEREGDNLITVVPITFSQASLGADIEIPGLLDKEKLHIPRGTQSHTELRIPGKGMPNVRNNNRHGDLRVIVIVETPQVLTEKQEKLLRELAELEHKEVSPGRKSLFERLGSFFKKSE